MRIAYLILLISLTACKQKNAASVQQAMNQYDSAIRRMDAHAIANIYAPDGELGNVAKGRDSIEKFLSKFKDAKVLSQSSTSTSVHIDHDTALQKGSYEQHVIVNRKDTLTVSGDYTATWVWLRNEGWKLKRMETKSH